MDDILYSPLDVGQPPSQPDFSTVVEWAKATAAKQSEALSTHLSFQSYSPCGYRCCVYSALHGGWQDGFESVFPEVAAYLDKLPTVKADLLIMMLCTKEDLKASDLDKVEFFNTEVPHMDPDRRLALGMRYYMYHDNKPRLQWRTVKPKFKPFYDAKIRIADSKRIGIEFAPEHCTEPVYAQPLDGPHAWVLSNVLAPHNVDVADVPKRCLLSVMGLDYALTETLVAASAIKHEANVLRLKDLT